jgi:dTDP-4-dehydrorhamnose reductase
MRLLITGAGGMLGTEMVRAARQDGHDVVASSHAELDIVNAPACDAAIPAARADTVINCAAFTDVDGAESDEGAATAVNGHGAGNVAHAAAKAGATIVQVSSDYVFDGASAEPYVESDPTAPLSAYGRSKLAGELAVAAAHPRGHAIVRSSWLFGAGGKNFVETMLRLGAERDEVAVVTDQVGCPTWTGHLARGLIELCSTFAPGIHHMAGDGVTSWHDFAVQIFKTAQVDCRVRPTTTAQLPRAARRPAYSALARTRPETPSLPSWQMGLATYLEERQTITAAAVATRGHGAQA